MTSRYTPRQDSGSLDAPHLTGQEIPDPAACGTGKACNTLEAAVAAARRGWAVFPCQPGGKTPAVPDNWEGRACADPDRVARFWPSPKHNVGVACGPSRLVVVDLDCHGDLPDEWRQLPGIHDGRDVLAQLCEWARQPWPVTYWTATPSGGWHLYFAAPEGSVIRNSAGLLGPQVDVRASGGYVIGAGIVGGKRYEVLDDMPTAPLPQWIGRLLTRRPGPEGVSQGDPARCFGRFGGLVYKVENAPVGERNNILYWAGCRAQEMVAAGEISEPGATAFLVSAAVAVGLPERDARKTIASAMRGGAR